MVEDENVVFVSSESEEDESNIWSKKSKDKNFKRLWEKARDIIFHYLSSSQTSSFPYQAFKDFAEDLKRSLNETYLESVREFLWTNVVRWISTMKLSYTGIADLKYDEKFNIIVTDLMVEYVNFKCRTFKKCADDDEKEQRINDILTVLNICLSGNVSNIVMALALIDVREEYASIQYRVFEKFLSDKRSHQTDDFISYLRLILCYKNWKKMAPLKEDKEKINEIAVGKSMKTLKSEGVPAADQEGATSGGVLPKKMPAITESNRMFMAVSGLIIFAKNKPFATRILLINKTLDRDEAAEKFFNLYKVFISKCDEPVQSAPQELVTIDCDDDDTDAENHVANFRPQHQSTPSRRSILRAKPVQELMPGGPKQSQQTPGIPMHRHLSTNKKCDINNLSQPSFKRQLDNRSNCSKSKVGVGSQHRVSANVIEIDSTDEEDNGVPYKANETSTIAGSSNFRAKPIESVDTVVLSSSDEEASTAASRPRYRRPVREKQRCIPGEVSSTTLLDANNPPSTSSPVPSTSSNCTLEVHSAGGLANIENAREVGSGTLKIISPPSRSETTTRTGLSSDEEDANGEPTADWRTNYMKWIEEAISSTTEVYQSKAVDEPSGSSQSASENVVFSTSVPCTFKRIRLNAPATAVLPASPPSSSPAGSLASQDLVENKSKTEEAAEAVEKPSEQIEEVKAIEQTEEVSKPLEAGPSKDVDAEKPEENTSEDPIEAERSPKPSLGVSEMIEDVCEDALEPSEENSNEDKAEHELEEVSNVLVENVESKIQTTSNKVVAESVEDSVATNKDEETFAESEKQKEIEKVPLQEDSPTEKQRDEHPEIDEDQAKEKTHGIPLQEDCSSEEQRDEHPEIDEEQVKGKCQANLDNDMLNEADLPFKRENIEIKEVANTKEEVHPEVSTILYPEDSVKATSNQEEVQEEVSSILEPEDSVKAAKSLEEVKGEVPAILEPEDSEKATNNQEKLQVEVPASLVPEDSVKAVKSLEEVQVSVTLEHEDSEKATNNQEEEQEEIPASLEPEDSVKAAKSLEEVQVPVTLEHEKSVKATNNQEEEQEEIPASLEPEDSLKAVKSLEEVQGEVPVILEDSVKESEVDPVIEETGLDVEQPVQEDLNEETMEITAVLEAEESNIEIPANTNPEHKVSTNSDLEKVSLTSSDLEQLAPESKDEIKSDDNKSTADLIPEGSLVLESEKVLAEDSADKSLESEKAEDSTDKSSNDLIPEGSTVLESEKAEDLSALDLDTPATLVLEEIVDHIEHAEEVVLSNVAIEPAEIEVETTFEAKINIPGSTQDDNIEVTEFYETIVKRIEEEDAVAQSTDPKSNQAKFLEENFALEEVETSTYQKTPLKLRYKQLNRDRLNSQEELLPKAQETPQTDVVRNLMDSFSLEGNCGRRKKPKLIKKIVDENPEIESEEIAAANILAGMKLANTQPQPEAPLKASVVKRAKKPKGEKAVTQRVTRSSVPQEIKDENELILSNKKMPKSILKKPNSGQEKRDNVKKRINFVDCVIEEKEKSSAAKYSQQEKLLDRPIVESLAFDAEGSQSPASSDSDDIPKLVIVEKKIPTKKVARKMPANASKKSLDNILPQLKMKAEQIAQSVISPPSINFEEWKNSLMVSPTKSQSCKKPSTVTHIERKPVVKSEEVEETSEAVLKSRPGKRKQEVEEEAKNPRLRRRKSVFVENHVAEETDTESSQAKSRLRRRKSVVLENQPLAEEPAIVEEPEVTKSSRLRLRRKSVFESPLEEPRVADDNNSRLRRRKSVFIPNPISTETREDVCVKEEKVAVNENSRLRRRKSVFIETLPLSEVAPVDLSATDQMEKEAIPEISRLRRRKSVFNETNPLSEEALENVSTKDQMQKEAIPEISRLRRRKSVFMETQPIPEETQPKRKKVEEPEARGKVELDGNEPKADANADIKLKSKKSMKKVEEHAVVSEDVVVNDVEEPAAPQTEQKPVALPKEVESPKLSKPRMKKVEEHAVVSEDVAVNHVEKPAAPPKMQQKPLDLPKEVEKPKNDKPSMKKVEEHAVVSEKVAVNHVEKPEAPPKTEQKPVALPKEVEKPKLSKPRMKTTPRRQLPLVKKSPPPAAAVEKPSSKPIRKKISVLKALDVIRQHMGYDELPVVEEKSVEGVKTVAKKEDLPKEIKVKEEAVNLSSSLKHVEVPVFQKVAVENPEVSTDKLLNAIDDILTKEENISKSTLSTVSLEKAIEKALDDTKNIMTPIAIDDILTKEEKNSKESNEATEKAPEVAPINFTDVLMTPIAIDDTLTKDRNSAKVSESMESIEPEDKAPEETPADSKDVLMTSIAIDDILAKEQNGSECHIAVSESTESIEKAGETPTDSKDIIISTEPEKSSGEVRMEREKKKSPVETVLEVIKEMVAEVRASTSIEIPSTLAANVPVVIQAPKDPASNDLDQCTESEGLLETAKASQSEVTASTHVVAELIQSAVVVDTTTLHLADIEPLKKVETEEPSRTAEIQSGKPISLKPKPSKPASFAKVDDFKQLINFSHVPEDLFGGESDNSNSSEYKFPNFEKMHDESASPIGRPKIANAHQMKKFRVRIKRSRAIQSMFENENKKVEKEEVQEKVEEASANEVPVESAAKRSVDAPIDDDVQCANETKMKLFLLNQYTFDGSTEIDPFDMPDISSFKESDEVNFESPFDCSISSEWPYMFDNYFKDLKTHPDAGKVDMKGAGTGNEAIEPLLLDSFTPVEPSTTSIEKPTIPLGSRSTHDPIGSHDHILGSVLSADFVNPLDNGNPDYSFEASETTAPTNSQLVSVASTDVGFDLEVGPDNQSSNFCVLESDFLDAADLFSFVTERKNDISLPPPEFHQASILSSTPKKSEVLPSNSFMETILKPNATLSKLPGFNTPTAKMQMVISEKDLQEASTSKGFAPNPTPDQPKSPEIEPSLPLTPTSKLKSYPFPSWKNRSSKAAEQIRRPSQSVEASPVSQTVKASDVNAGINESSAQTTDDPSKSFFHMPELDHTPVVSVVDPEPDSTKVELDLQVGSKRPQTNLAPLDEPPKKKMNISEPKVDLFDQLKNEPPAHKVIFRTTLASEAVKKSPLATQKPIHPNCVRLPKVVSSPNITSKPSQPVVEVKEVTRPSPPPKPLPDTANQQLSHTKARPRPEPEFKNYPKIEKKSTTADLKSYRIPSHSSQRKNASTPRPPITPRIPHSAVNQFHISLPAYNADKSKTTLYQLPPNLMEPQTYREHKEAKRLLLLKEEEQRCKEAAARGRSQSEHRTKYIHSKPYHSQRERHSKSVKPPLRHLYVTKVSASAATSSATANGHTYPTFSSNLTTPTAWDYKPISADEILQHLASQKKQHTK